MFLAAEEALIITQSYLILDLKSESLIDSHQELALHAKEAVGREQDAEGLLGDEDTLRCDHLFQIVLCAPFGPGVEICCGFRAFWKERWL